LNKDQQSFTSLAEAIEALHASAEPMTLTRFGEEPGERVIVAVNEAAAAIPTIPTPGEHPDDRRDSTISTDVELEYLHRQLLERGHAQQMISYRGRLVEMAFDRIYVEGDDSVYAFVSPLRRIGG
jgi:hypothetical protein